MNVTQLVIPYICLCVVAVLLLIFYFSSSYMDTIETKRQFSLQGFHGLHRLDKAENQVRFIKNEGNRTFEELIPRLTSPVMLSMTNAGYMRIAENMIASVTRLNLKYDVVLICEDDISFDFFQNRTNIYVIKTYFARNISASQAHRSKFFEELVNRKVFYVMALVKRGIDVFYADSDIVFVQDPDPYLRYDFDVIAIDEADVPYCPGLFYIRSTEASNRMLLAWKSFQIDKESNQIAFNKAMHLTDGLTITRFHPYLFITGGLYLAKKYDWRTKEPLPVVIHFNERRPPETNIERIKEANVWYVNS